MSKGTENRKIKINLLISWTILVHKKDIVDVYPKQQALKE